MKQNSRKKFQSLHIWLFFFFFFQHMYIYNIRSHIWIKACVQVQHTSYMKRHTIQHKNIHYFSQGLISTKNLITVGYLKQTRVQKLRWRTSCPSLTPISWETRAATLIAATRRGCVHPICTERPKSWFKPRLNSKYFQLTNLLHQSQRPLLNFSLQRQLGRIQFTSECRKW